MGVRVNLKSCLVMAMFLMAIGGGAAVGQIIYVDADATGANNGSSWTDAYNYLQDALADANSGDEIWVAEGIYKPDQGIGITPGDRAAKFQLINGVTLRGGYAGFGEPDPNARDITAYESILSGDLDGNDVDVNEPADLLDEPTRAENSYHVVTGDRSSWPDLSVVVDGFTITGGNANEYWPSHEERGGGMYFCGGKIINCTISCNSARSSGGGMCYSTGEIINCTIMRNFASGRGGGMSYSDVQMSNCIISENSAVEGGGGINNTAGDMMLTNCLLTRNSARQGAAIWYINGNFGIQTLVNCTFSGNSAEECGGAIYLDYSSPTLTNCILWGDTPQEIYDRDHRMPVITYSDIEGGCLGEGNIDADPCFADALNGDYHLKSQAGRWDANEGRWTIDEVTSPCIDGGDMASPIGYEPFPNGGRVNMGAYGGTAEASKSYFGEPVCATIVAGDINGDCKVNFLDFRLMALHWLEDNNPPPVTTTYVFQPDPNALCTSGGFAGQGQGSRSIEGRFELTIDFDVGIAWFNNVDATLSEEVWIEGHNGEGSIFTDSLDVIFNMTELVSTDVSETTIDFLLDKGDCPGCFPPYTDIHLRATFIENSVHLVGDFCDPCCDRYCFHLDAVAVAE